MMERHTTPARLLWLRVMFGWPLRTRFHQPVPSTRGARPEIIVTEPCRSRAGAVLALSPSPRRRAVAGHAAGTDTGVLSRRPGAPARDRGGDGSLVGTRTFHRYCSQLERPSPTPAVRMEREACRPSSSM